MSKAAMEVYERLSLPSDGSSFRLLELDFDSDSASADVATIHATMGVYHFDNAPQYEAISYTWGAQGKPKNIKLNCQSFPVAPNLIDALHQLRLNQSKDGKHKRKLWVDAICINQADNKDKSHQVMRMREIYANAVEVLIWIGNADNLSPLAFDTLERFSADDGTQGGSATYQDILSTVKERKTAIQLLIERPYFGRVWVVQEVVVAKEATVHCGSFSMPFKLLYLAMMRMTGSGFYPFSIFAQNVIHLGNWRRSFLEIDADREDSLDLRIFMDSRDRDATILSDKVYALRGITNDKLAEGIIVDYDKSTERVYTDFANYLLGIRPYLRVLSSVSVQHRKTSTLRLPSWVPDWSQPIHLGCILNRYYRFSATKLFCAAGNTTPRLTRSESSDTICLEGLCLDTISRVIPIIPLLKVKDETSISVTEASLREMAAEVISLETYPFTGEPSWRAFFRTVTTDRTAFSSRIDEDYRSKFLGSFRDWNLNEGATLPAEAWAEVSKTIWEIIEYKAMFLTSRGYLGMGQEGLKAGDFVCIFLGGEVPFLLRRIEDYSIDRFQFLSECYAHGVMDGEAMIDMDATEKHLVTFSIE
jgi:hypothetical protein